MAYFIYNIHTLRHNQRTKILAIYQALREYQEPGKNIAARPLLPAIKDHVCGHTKLNRELGQFRASRDISSRQSHSSQRLFTTLRASTKLPFGHIFLLSSRGQVLTLNVLTIYLISIVDTVVVLVTSNMSN